MHDADIAEVKHSTKPLLQYYSYSVQAQRVCRNSHAFQKKILTLEQISQQEGLRVVPPLQRFTSPGDAETTVGLVPLSLRQSSCAFQTLQREFKSQTHLFNNFL